MNIDNLTVGEVKTICNLFSHKTENVTEPWEIGKIYLIRTVTMIDTGRLVAVTSQELVLEDAAWISDTGRFSDSLKEAVKGNDKFSEVEPFPDGKVIIGRSAIIDAVQINSIPRSIR